MRFDLSLQGLEGLEDAPPVELQLLHECSPSQVSPDRLPGSEVTFSLPYLFLFKFMFSYLMWEMWEGILLFSFSVIGVTLCSFF